MTEQLTEREKEDKFKDIQDRLTSIQREMMGASERLEYLMEDVVDLGSLLMTKEAKDKNDAEFHQACKETFDECMKDPSFARAINGIGIPNPDPADTSRKFGEVG